jgi:ankyrin repeat protein
MSNRARVARLKKEYEMEVEYATPLMYAAALSSRKVAKILLEEEADATVANSGGATALMIAAALDDRVLVNLLLAFGASTDDQLENAAFLIPPGCGSAGRAASVGKWLPGDASGATALWLSACAGNAAALNRLLEGGADTALEASCRNLTGAGETESCTPYRAAELLGRDEVMALFETASKDAPVPALSSK